MLQKFVESLSFAAVVMPVGSSSAWKVRKLVFFFFFFFNSRRSVDKSEVFSMCQRRILEKAKRRKFSPHFFRAISVNYASFFPAPLILFYFSLLSSHAYRTHPLVFAMLKKNSPDMLYGNNNLS